MRFSIEEYALLEALMRSVAEQSGTGAAGDTRLRIWKELVIRLQMQQPVMGAHLHELNMQARMYLHKNDLSQEQRDQLELLCKKMKRTSHSFR